MRALSMAALGRRVNLSAPAVAERVQRLEREGVIRGYRVDVDPVALGYASRRVIRVAPAARQLEKIRELARESPEVVECHRITGEDCFFLKVHLRRRSTSSRHCSTGSRRSAARRRRSSTPRRSTGGRCLCNPRADLVAERRRRRLRSRRGSHRRPSARRHVGRLPGIAAGARGSGRRAAAASRGGAAQERRRGRASDGEPVEQPAAREAHRLGGRAERPCRRGRKLRRS